MWKGSPLFIFQDQNPGSHSESDVRLKARIVNAGLMCYQQRL